MATFEELEEEVKGLRGVVDRLAQESDERPRPFGRRLTNALVSTNFQAGKTGYRIRDNGDAEFNEITVRGDLLIGDTVNGPWVEMRDTDGSINLYDTDGILRMKLGGSSVPSMRLFDSAGTIAGTIKGFLLDSDIGSFVTINVSDSLFSVATGVTYEFEPRRFSTSDTATLGGSSQYWQRAYVDRLMLTDGRAEPDTASGTWDTSGAVIYIDSADGDLKIKFIDGVVKTIVTDTA